MLHFTLELSQASNACHQAELLEALRHGLKRIFNKRVDIRRSSKGQRGCGSCLHDVAFFLSLNTPSPRLGGSNSALNPRFDTGRDIPPSCPEGRFDADVVSFYNELGRRFAVGGTSQLTPFLGLSVGDAQMDGFTERDPHRMGARLKVSSSDADSLSTVVGLRYNGVWGAFRPQLAVGWEHEFEDTAHSVTGNFVDSPSKEKFTVTGSDLSDDSLFVDAGGAYLLGASSDLSFRYVGRWQSDYDSQSVMGRYTYRFGGAAEALPVTQPLKLGQN